VRVATYTRISTDEERQPFSLEAQTTRLGAYITSQGDWEKVREFTDQRSGATLDRSGLQRCLAEAKARRFDLLLVYRVDRLSRSVRGLAQILEDLDAVGVAFRSATEPFDTTTPAGRMMVQMLGVFAEFERSTIVDRVIAGMERKAARGAWTSGTYPYGYRANKETGVLHLVEEEAPLVPIIFKQYAAGRLGTRALASWLNERGYRTRTGRLWSHIAVVTVLRNRAYVGEIFFRDQWHQAPHQPLVSVELFEAVQAVMTERCENYSKRASNPSEYLFTGLMRCAHCGKRYIGTAATGRSARYRYYTCFSRQRYGPERCDADRIPADPIESALRDQLRRTFQNTSLLEESIEAWRADHNADTPLVEDQLGQVEADIAKSEEAVEGYLLAFEARTMPEPLCGERLQILSKKITDLRCRKAELTAQLDDTRDGYDDLDLPELQALVDEVFAIDSSADMPTMKALFQQLVDGIEVVNRHEIHPTFRVPSLVPAVRIVDGLVEVSGLEPPTSTLRTWRSTS
jgi:site-specific DNA recombinase